MLTNYFVKCAVNELKELFEAPEKELSLWVHLNAKKFLDIQEYYPEDNTCDKMFYVLDTVDRDTLFDAAGMYFVNQPWPRHGDSEEYATKFENKMKNVLTRYNWKLKGEEHHATSTQVELRQGAA